MPPATTTADASAVPGDPTLSVLVPKSSRRRNVVFVVLAVVTLLAVAFALPVLRPSVADNWGASSASDHSGRIIVTMLEITGETLPWLKIDSVDPVAGAVPEGAWLLPGDALDVGDNLTPKDYRDPQNLLAGQLPGEALKEYRLPRRLSSNEDATLVIAWRVTDCSTLDNRNSTTVQARSVIGLQSTMTVPMFDGGLAGLARDGVCPKRSRNSR